MTLEHLKTIEIKIGVKNTGQEKSTWKVPTITRCDIGYDEGLVVSQGNQPLAVIEWGQLRQIIRLTSEDPKHPLGISRIT